MLKFCEFLHRIRVIFYLRFRPLDVPMYAFGTKNEDFRSKSPYPLSALEATSLSEVASEVLFVGLFVDLYCGRLKYTNGGKVILV